MVIREVLQRARELLSQGWTQRREARDAWGEPVLAVAPEAVRWCALGALRRAEYDVGAVNSCGGLLAEEAVRAALPTAGDPGGGSITAWNDAYGRSLSEVLAVFDAAIARHAS